jgi:phosphopantothenoylcysteine decarboxylase/phosphopantothenate--cysteine ligase
VSQEPSQKLAGKTIVLGVCGSVAAYRAADLAREFMRRGANVYAILTAAACNFVTPALFRALTNNVVTSDAFDEPQPGRIWHIDLPKQADLFVIAPASANSMAKFAHGLADDMLSTAFLANTAPVLIAPAMNPRMYESAASLENMRVLRERGCRFVEPAFGTMVCGDEGQGRLAETGELADAAERILLNAGDMRGWKVLVSAGPTQEPIDPVRYVGNRSSGKMGYAVAEAAMRRGAEVTLITGPTALTPPQVTVVKVRTAEQMHAAVSDRFGECDVLIMAAAVADFRPESPQGEKHKRGTDAWTVDLVPNADIAAEMGNRKTRQLLVGFAAETSNMLAHAAKKLEAKKLDLIAANDVTEPGSGFDTDTNRLTLIYPDGRIDPLPLLSKAEAAHRLLDAILALRSTP